MLFENVLGKVFEAKRELCLFIAENNFKGRCVAMMSRRKFPQSHRVLLVLFETWIVKKLERPALFVSRYGWKTSPSWVTNIWASRAKRDGKVLLTETKSGKINNPLESASFCAGVRASAEITRMGGKLFVFVEGSKNIFTHLMGYVTLCIMKVIVPFSLRARINWLSRYFVTDSSRSLIDNHLKVVWRSRIA